MDQQEFAFQVDHDIRKLVTVARVGPSLDVSVRFAAEVGLNSSTTRLFNAIHPQLRADDLPERHAPTAKRIAIVD